MANDTGGEKNNHSTATGKKPKPNESEEQERLGQIRLIGIVTTIPMVLLAGPLVGYFIGSYLDKWLGFEPWLMVIFTFLGMIASVRNLIDILGRINK